VKIRSTRTWASVALSLALAVHANAALAQAAPESGQALVDRAVGLMHAEEIPLVRLQSLVINGVEQAKIGLDQRLPADKVAPVMVDVNAMAVKTLNEVVPPVREAGVKLAPGVLGPILREKFTDDELRQLVALLESPVRKKYEALLPQLQDAIGKAVTEQTQAEVNPKLQGMGKQISARIAQALLPK